MAEAKKKQIPLRLSTKLYAALASWAEDDFRSVNGQIEYLLTECVKQRKKTENTYQKPLTNHLRLIFNTFSCLPCRIGEFFHLFCQVTLLYKKNVLS